MANNLVQRDGRARAAVGQGKLDEAITLYRDLLTPGPQQKWTAMLDPLHVIAFARVLDKAGRRDAARGVPEVPRVLERRGQAPAGAVGGQSRPDPIRVRPRRTLRPLAEGQRQAEVAS